MTKTGEILVLARSAMPAEWLPGEGSVAMGWSEFVAAIESAGGSRWMARDAAEENPEWKQPIPYIVLRDGAGSVALYRRRGSEERLHGLWSAGIGGHVERDDAAEGIAATLLRCARRELAEEVPGCTADLRFRGLINEEVTAVGRVHWGVVFEARVTDRPAGGDELGELEWLAPAAALEKPLERWSRLALGLCREIASFRSR